MILEYITLKISIFILYIETWLRGSGPPMASCPPALRGLIEARGLGILTTSPAKPAPVAAIVDLSQTEHARLPPERTQDLLGWPVPLIHNVETDHFAPALLLYLKGGRSSG